MHARRVAPSLARQVGTRGLVSSQLPDLSKLNSVPGPSSLESIAGSTSPEGLSTERPLVGAGSFVDDSTSE